jgi:formylglycine-generating enzyme required for sulfatase activity
VTLTQGYWLGKTEVTQAQWETLMGTTVAQQRDKAGPELPLWGQGPDYPMYYVNWDDAMEFCRKLTKRERSAGRLPEGYEYQLPTEAQWEYACRAGTTGDYAGNLDAMAWYAQNSGNTIHPVAQKRANAWGLYDMHGNVGEWCADWNGNYPGGPVRDPTGPTSGGLHLSRGGSWNFLAPYCRSASRWLDPGIRFFNQGFRLALAPAW